MNYDDTNDDISSKTTLDPLKAHYLKTFYEKAQDILKDASKAVHLTEYLRKAVKIPLY